MANIILQKKVNDDIVDLYPKTNADIVDYDEVQTVKEKIQDILNAVSELKYKLSIDQLYLTDKDGNYLTDEYGRKLVAVASLISSVTLSAGDVEIIDYEQTITNITERLVKLENIHSGEI